jgi:hypothetical protein
MYSERQWEIADWLIERTQKSSCLQAVRSWVALDDEELIAGGQNTRFREMFDG